MSLPWLIGLGLLCASAPTAHTGGFCQNTSWGFTPLTELGNATFLGATGGLYAAGSNLIPPDHLLAGLAQAALIQPLDATGQPDPDGKIGVICLGMSNANNLFAVLAEILPVADNVIVVNAAFGGVHAGAWANATNTVWTNLVPLRLTEAGLTPAQVQVVLHYHGMAHSIYPPQPWPDTPQDFQTFCEQIATNTLAVFPNNHLTFWSSREYGGYATTINNPEPYAYYSGFATKWMIKKQIDGHPDLNWDSQLGPVTTSWMAWGPYTWADGLIPRADGLFYECRDFQNDGTHPRTRARAKLAGLWADFLAESPLTSSWMFPTGNLPPMVKMISPPENVMLNTRGIVALEAFARDLDGDIAHVDFFADHAWIGVSTSAPFSLLWLNAPTGIIPVHAVATDLDGLATTSLTTTIRLQNIPVASNQVLLASDNFESGDFVGGFGWVQQGWQVLGPADVTTSNAPPEGLWQARLRGDSRIQRGLLLDPTRTNATLTFWWRGNLPANYTFLVEVVIQPSTNLLFSATQSTNQPTQISIPLDAYLPATNLILRYRVPGPANDGQVLIDDIQLWSQDEPSAEWAVDVPHPDPNRWTVRWPVTIGTTYELIATTNTQDWIPLYTTTAEETSDAAFLPPRDPAYQAYGVRLPLIE
ncbi:MAG TPA: Ig-like domain-containing protein [Kiritimatiellia bacterium]|nr:Ig-like domain-containing protein [Kiritimatiellia bacterium]